MQDNVSDIGFASERTIKRNIIFFIPGTPVPLQRPRMSGNHCWDSQKQKKLVVSLSLETQLKNSRKFEGPLCVELIFCFPIGSRVAKSKRPDILGKPHIFKPDIDNCIKFILDCSNEILWHDDRLVAIIFAKKVYGIPGTTMKITELE